jgi:hypothetical protein
MSTRHGGVPPSLWEGRIWQGQAFPWRGGIHFGLSGEDSDDGGAWGS